MRTWLKANPKLAAATVVVYMFLVAAAAISAVDIIHLAEKYGVPAPVSWTAPLFVDGLAWLGKIARSRDFADKTRRVGLGYMMFGGVLSLFANIWVGSTLGLKVYGALVVTGFIAAEILSAILEGKAAPAVAAEEKTTTPARKVGDAEKAARKRAKYDDMDANAKAEWTRKYRARVASQAPVSPGQPPVNAPSVAELVAALR